MDDASVRTPQPVNISGESRCSATCAALSSSTMPVQRQWPMLEARLSIGRLSRSRPRANQPRSGSQTPRVNAWSGRRAAWAAAGGERGARGRPEAPVERGAGAAGAVGPALGAVAVAGLLGESGAGDV